MGVLTSKKEREYHTLLLKKVQGAETNLSTEKNPSKKDTWFSSKNEYSRWTEGIETKAAQGSLQADSIKVLYPSVCISNEKGTAPYPERSIYHSLFSGQVLGKRIVGNESPSQWIGDEQIWFFGKQEGRQCGGAKSGKETTS